MDHELAERAKAILRDEWSRTVELFRSPEANELVEPAVWIFTHLDPPAVELVERLQYTALKANRKVLDYSPNLPLDPGYRAVFVGFTRTTIELHVLETSLASDHYPSTN